MNPRPSTEQNALRASKDLRSAELESRDARVEPLRSRARPERSFESRDARVEREPAARGPGDRARGPCHAPTCSNQLVAAL